MTKQKKRRKGGFYGVTFSYTDFLHYCLKEPDGAAVIATHKLNKTGFIVHLLGQRSDQALGFFSNFKHNPFL